MRLGFDARTNGMADEFGCVNGYEMSTNLYFFLVTEYGKIFSRATWGPSRAGPGGAAGQAPVRRSLFGAVRPVLGWFHGKPGCTIVFGGTFPV